MVAATLLLASFGRQTAALPWRINENNSLFWNDVPYLPCGLRIDSTEAAIKGAKAHKISDVLVELSGDPGKWGETIQLLESQGLRYMIALTSLAEPTVGVAVEPEGYRITGVTGPRKVEAAIAGGQSALVVVAAKSDGSVLHSMRTPIVDGRISADVNAPADVESVILIYPILREARFPDYWDQFDAYRDRLLQGLKGAKLGPGYRGLVNPLGTVMQFPRQEERFVPVSPLFRLDLENYLLERYPTLQTALKSWSLSAVDFTSFSSLARLVPLWTTTRGISQLWDPETDQLYRCDNRRSMAWRDISDALRLAGQRRYERLVQAIQKTTQAPVIQDWSGWYGPYDFRTSMAGIGMPMGGSNLIALLDGSCSAASSSLRKKTNNWLVATDIVSNPNVKISDVLTQAASMGARGWFVRAKDEATINLVAEEAAQRSSDASFSQWKAKAIFFPESAKNPVAPMQAAGGIWWLPSPEDGSRLDYGSIYTGYRTSIDGHDTVVIWSARPGTKIRLRFSSPKDIKVSTIDGGPSKTKSGRNYVEVTFGQTPLMIQGSSEIPIPEDALLETTGKIDAILKSGSNRIGFVDEETAQYKQLLGSFESAPGASFFALRQLLHKLAMRSTGTTWIECENSKDNNFSEVQPVPGCSANAALSLRARLLPEDGVFRATFSFNARDAGDSEIWIAARLPQSAVPGITFNVGNAVTGIQEGPISFYGSGFAWYRLAPVTLARGKVSIVMQARVAEGTDLAVDAIVIAPQGFRPSGAIQPD